jgi:hypothetical protein
MAKSAIAALYGFLEIGLAGKLLMLICVCSDVGKGEASFLFTGDQATDR